MNRMSKLAVAAMAVVAGGTAYFAAPTTRAQVPPPPAPQPQPVAPAPQPAAPPMMNQPMMNQPSEIDFRSGTISIGITKGTEAVVPTSVNFANRQVLSAQVLLKGFDIEYIDADHALHREVVRFENIDAQGETVKFDTRVLLRDNSGDIDDKYAGKVDYVVIARLR